jgi:hypothetical protein
LWKSSSVSNTFAAASPSRVEGVGIERHQAPLAHRGASLLERQRHAVALDAEPGDTQPDRARSHQQHLAPGAAQRARSTSTNE